MKTAFSSSSFYSNLPHPLLIHMGLLKSEDKIKAIATCTVPWWCWTTWCSRTTSPGPLPPCCWHSWPSPAAPWNPVPLPTTIYYRCCKGLDAKLASPHPSPGPVTWEGTQQRTLASSREGHCHVCVSLECVCQCGKRAGMCLLSGFEFLMFPCWTGPGPTGAQLTPKCKGCRLFCH